MNHLLVRRTIALALILNVVGMGFPTIVHAGLVGTQSLIESQVHENRLAKIDAMLARHQVRDQFIAMGVDSEQVQARLAALTESELQTLAGHMDELPAGGNVLVVVGVVFVVLLILELVGVTDVFKKP